MGIGSNTVIYIIKYFLSCLFSVNALNESIKVEHTAVSITARTPKRILWNADIQFTFTVMSVHRINSTEWTVNVPIRLIHVPNL